MIRRRLDFWLVSNGMQEDIENVDIVPSIKSDHSAIVLSITGLENQSRGPSFWKLNSSLLEDKEYGSLINDIYPLWNDEFKEVQDPRVRFFGRIRKRICGPRSYGFFDTKETQNPKKDYFVMTRQAGGTQYIYQNDISLVPP